MWADAWPRQDTRRVSARTGGAKVRPRGSQSPKWGTGRVQRFSHNPPYSPGPRWLQKPWVHPAKGPSRLERCMRHEPPCTDTGVKQHGGGGGLQGARAAPSTTRSWPFGIQQDLTAGSSLPWAVRVGPRPVPRRLLCRISQPCTPSGRPDSEGPFSLHGTARTASAAAATRRRGRERTPRVASACLEVGRCSPRGAALALELCQRSLDALYQGRPFSLHCSDAGRCRTPATRAHEPDPGGASCIPLPPISNRSSPRLRLGNTAFTPRRSKTRWTFSSQSRKKEVSAWKSPGGR